MERPQYANKAELLLSLVGYAVGLGNIWRFPYLVFTYGGGAFLIPYFFFLCLLGAPLFIMEMGLGQIFQQGTLGIWEAMHIPRWKGVGAAATVCTFMVSLYYNVILTWTIYYLGRTIAAIPSGVLPWSDQAAGFVCPATVLFPRSSIRLNSDLLDHNSGLFNPKYGADFWCPATGIPTLHSAAAVPDGFTMVSQVPSSCPARAAMEFWSSQALMQSSGMDDLGGFHYGLLASFAVAWLAVYLCVFKGVQSSGKVVYVTAILPYVILVVFFFRAITLENAYSGIQFYLATDFSKLCNKEVWIRAATQIFYSLGVGFGSLIAFASYGNKKNDFVGDATKVAVINCGTSFFAGFVVFPILGYLAYEMSKVNPCMQSGDINDLSSIGLSGTGLAFIAFPIAISKMPWGFFWAILFFIMLLCLGIDSQFAMVESVMTVLSDAHVGQGLPKAALAAIVCGVSALLGLIFVTKGGIYWFNFFDYYTCVTALFFVCLMECIGLMWYDPEVWPRFKESVREATGWNFGKTWEHLFKNIAPAFLLVLFCLSFSSFDLMGARTSVRYPQGTGYLPVWSIYVGWAIGLLPMAAFTFFYVTHKPQKKVLETGAYGSTAVGHCA